MTGEAWALTVAVFAPLIGACAVAALPARREGAALPAGIAVSALALAAGFVVAVTFDYGAPAMMQAEADLAWIPASGVRWHIGVDGISLPLLLLSLLMSVLCFIYLAGHVPQPGRSRSLVALLLLLETGMSGTFIALDLILFFVLWEAVLVPMFFIIGIWGGPNRQHAAIKFFLYTFLGSVVMLLAFLAIRFAGGSFDLTALAAHPPSGMSGVFGATVFLGLFLGFAVKLPLWPLHSWLPDAHTEAPTVGSVLLAAVMLKMGGYGFIRIALPLLPDAALAFAPLMGVLGAVAIVYGALCCLAQHDLKRLIAFSSIGHMGFVMLGIATLTGIGLNGAVFAMVAHGLITGLLFFLAGSLQERYRTRELGELGGVLGQTPRFGSLLTSAAIASLGLPGLAGFWGEMLALLGAYQPAAELPIALFRALMAVGGLGIILTAGYFLWMLQRVTLGRPFRSSLEVADVGAIEWAAWAPLAALILGAGVFPQLVLGPSGEAVRQILAGVSS